jgi:hypothetical protein
VHDYFTGTEVRGFYVMHRMGAGKTRLACAVALTLMERGRRVIFLAPKALHDNFRMELRQYLRLLATSKGAPPDEATIAAQEARFLFVSSNAGNVLDQLQRPEILEVNLDGALILVDEAHEFVNSITNGSKNATALYHTIMEARDIRLLFFSGTPIVNDPFELAVAFNLLAGPLAASSSARPGRRRAKTTTLFGEDYARFASYFIDRPEALELGEGAPAAPAGLGIKNREKFINRIAGLVSYYDPRQCEEGEKTEAKDKKGKDKKKTGKGAAKQGAAKKAKKAGTCLADRFPTVLQLEVVRVPMTSTQFAVYRLARQQEREEEARKFGHSSAPLTKGGTSSNSTYRILSRQLSNYLYPAAAGDVAMKSNESGTASRLSYERDLEKLREGDFAAAALAEHGPKLVALLRNVLRHLPWAATPGLRGIATAKGDASDRVTPGPGIVYSQFKDCGVELFARILLAHGWEQVELTDVHVSTASSDVHVGSKPKGAAPRFILLSGELKPEERTALLALRNAPGNEEGRSVALLLFTVVAARGISTRWTTHVHILEPYWNYSRDDQVISRADRLDSHADLPPERRFVHPYLYMAVKPEGFITNGDNNDEELTTDEYLHAKSLTNLQVGESFILAARSASIDCQLWSQSALQAVGLRCHICSPTGQTLFAPDLAIDMETPSPCRPPAERRVVAETIRIEDREYRWYIADGRPHLLQYHTQLGAFLPLPASHPDYAPLMERIA